MSAQSCRSSTTSCTSVSPVTTVHLLVSVCVHVLLLQRPGGQRHHDHRLYDVPRPDADPDTEPGPELTRVAAHRPPRAARQHADSVRTPQQRVTSLLCYVFFGFFLYEKQCYIV